MIASLKGVIQSKDQEEVIIDVGGIGYSLFMPFTSVSHLPDVGQDVFCYTYTYVKEDRIHLYGFLSLEDKKLFTTLLAINGIGPKLALAILSQLSAHQFAEAVFNEQINQLVSIPGLGKKTASRIILELKGKLTKELDKETASDPAAHDASSALVNLGYKKAEAEEAVRKALRKRVGGVENIIKEALKLLQSVLL
jgi:Holliday junction DNA helicase RuvA